MKQWAAIILLLLITSTQATEPQTTKDKVITDYFQIELVTTPYIENMEGWVNVTAYIHCINQSAEGPEIFPYEVVEYVLAVKDPVVGILDRVASTQLVTVPECNAVVEGRYYVTPQMTNLTLVHMFKPEHSRVPAKEYVVLQPIPATYVEAQGQIGLFLQNMLAKPLPLILLGCGVFLLLPAVILFFYNKLMSIAAFIIAVLLIITGVLMV